MTYYTDTYTYTYKLLYLYKQLYNVKFLTIYETFENVRKIFPKSYQNKAKMPGKHKKCLVYL